MKGPKLRKRSNELLTRKGSCKSIWTHQYNATSRTKSFDEKQIFQTRMGLPSLFLEQQSQLRGFVLANQ